MLSMGDQLDFRDAADASRFELHSGTELVSVLDYRVQGQKIELTRAYTDPAQRGHGYAGIITERAVRAIAERGTQQVVPRCWYVADWFARHPEFRSLVANGH